MVLTAGGARGAYQAGVLKRLGEIPSLADGPSPFEVVAGASAGAINGAMLAANQATFREATAHLARLWEGLRVAEVFRTDLVSLARTVAGFARDLALGPVLGRTVTASLLDARPLHRLIAAAMPPGGISAAIRRGHLYAIAVSATSYHSGRAFTFVQGRAGHPVWVKSRRVVLPVELTPAHVCASAAIPIVFPPVALPTAGGDVYFGDGGLRLVTPLSPAIRLGATSIFAIGVRSQRAAEALSREELGSASSVFCPPLAQICGVFLNAIFLDHLDSDLDHLHRMNELAGAFGGLPPGADASVREPIRPIAVLTLAPSEDLAVVAQRLAHRMPRAVRYLMAGLGTPDSQSADLMSYLLFDTAYTRALIDIGYRDANERIGELEDFLRSAPVPRRATLAV